MPISKSKQLLLLIQSLTKAEKRNFRLFANRNQNKRTLLFVALFDMLDKTNTYDQKKISQSIGGISNAQLVNLKRHLYTQILRSLRVITISKRPNVEVREMIDFAYVLYDKALYLEAIKILDMAKKHATKYYLYHMQNVIIEFEKRIESRHITRTGTEKAYALIKESEQLNELITLSTKLSNLRTDLHARYLQNGHCQSNTEKDALKQFFHAAINEYKQLSLGPVESIYLYQSYVWYFHIILEFDNCLTYAEKWLKTLENNPTLIEKDVDLYLRAFHYVLSSCFHLKNTEKLSQFLEKVELFRKANYKRFNMLSKIISFQYVHTSRLNLLILSKDFTNSQKVITRTLSRINKHYEHIDPHKILVFYYKIAWIFFQCGNFSRSIFYLNKIINNQLPKLREDLQGYSRIMHLMCHYELGNFDLLNYTISTFKSFFSKLGKIDTMQDICKSTFLSLAQADHKDHLSIFQSSLEQIRILEANEFNKVSFTYLDILSWLTSKIEQLK